MPDGLTSVCVYCGSSPGADPAFAAAADAMGRLLAQRGVRLVYGGGHVGLMGIVADAALDEGGQAHGVITRSLQDREVAHPGLTTLDVVETMHERKARMSDLSDGFVMMPGGFGTLDEYFEAVTWTQLGVHAKPCAVLDVAGYFGPLLEFIDRAVEQRFISESHRETVIVGSTPASVLDRMARWRPATTDKWLDRSER